MKKLLLIDSHSLIHRCFHALPPLHTPAGQPAQAVYGVASVLLRLWKEERPAYVAAVFDRPEPTFRKERYADYKAQRPKAPDGLIPQLQETRRLMRAFGVRTFEAPGFEGDDLIATLAAKFRRTKDVQVIILTGDLDTLQLVEGKKVVVCTFRRGISDTLTYDEAAVKERYNLLPAQMIDYKALVGDPSDNIKGVPGIGSKTAADILVRFGTVENFFRSGAASAEKMKKFLPYEAQAKQAKNLVRLVSSVPVSVRALAELAVPPAGEAVAEYFKSMGFESLLKRVAGKTDNALPNPVRRHPVTGGRRRGGLFESAGGKTMPAMSPAETADPDAIFVGDLPSEAPVSFAAPALKVGFSLKDKIRELWRRGGDITEPYFDLGVAFWLLNPDFKDYFPAKAVPAFTKEEWRGGSATELKKLFQFCRAALQKQNLERIFSELEMPLVRVLAEMERAGIAVDVARLRRIEKNIQTRVWMLTKKIYALAGEEFNLNSPQQVGRVLFEKLGVKPRGARRTSGAFSTNAEHLKDLADMHPVVPLLLEYREHFKILSTYVRPLQECVAADGRVHTQFIQTGTATGRLSSQSPNLQNIPQESVWARDIRAAFAPPAGHSLLSFDYSQLELRILADVSGDTHMREMFRAGGDIHALTAARVLGVPPAKVSKANRRLAKTLNFGLMYGMGQSAFAKASGLTRAAARVFIQEYFRSFPEVRAWRERTVREMHANGYTQTLSGRRRYFPAPALASPATRAERERAAINHPIQGLAGDILKKAMIMVATELRQSKNAGARLILSIHDELLFEVRDDMIHKTALSVRALMEQASLLNRVPLVVDVSGGKNWGRMKKIF